MHFFCLTVFIPSAVRYREHVVLYMGKVRYKLGFPRIKLWRLILDLSEISLKYLLPSISGNYTLRKGLADD